VNRFGNGTEESKTRLQNAMNELWRYTGELFETTDEDVKLAKEGIAVDFSTLKQAWEKEINELLQKANVTIPENTYMQTGGRKGVHTEHLGYLLSEMQALPRMLPDAKW
jgi:ring-1,2-phenylacetyl-CoA epoxidase subunit PaaC